MAGGRGPCGLVMMAHRWHDTRSSGIPEKALRNVFQRAISELYHPVFPGFWDGFRKSVWLSELLFYASLVSGDGFACFSTYS